MEEKTWYEKLGQFLLEIGAGFSVSGLGSLLIPEVLHLFFVFIGGIVGTIAVHIARRWCKKHLPFN
jgi:hypothetical protein